LGPKRIVAITLTFQSHVTSISYLLLQTVFSRPY